MSILSDVENDSFIRRVASMVIHNKRKAVVSKAPKATAEVASAHAGHRTKVLSHMRQALKVRSLVLKFQHAAQMCAIHTNAWPVSHISCRSSKSSLICCCMVGCTCSEDQGRQEGAVTSHLELGKGRTPMLKT